MSDNFIPLNQSTPVQRQWNQGRNQNQNQSGFRNHFRNGNFRDSQDLRFGRRNQWGNNSSNNSFNSNQNNYSNNSYGNSKPDIDAYLHPSMLEDLWAQLRQQKKK